VASSSVRRLRVPRRLLAIVGLPTLLIVGGTFGYRWIERWPWFYSFYVSVITLTSIGYSERNPLSTAGRVFTMVLALGGISTVAFAASELISTIVRGELRAFWEGWRMAKRIGSLESHVIVCGYGYVGRRVCADLLDGGVGVVVVDREDGAVAAARNVGAHSFLGDASVESTLIGAGIRRARALIAATGADPDNVLVTMTARMLTPRLLIVARAEDDAMVPKLRHAGANLTVSPNAVAGGWMAEAVLRPATFDLIGDGAGNGRRNLRLEEQLVRPGSRLDGKTVGTSGFRSRGGPILIAIRRRDGKLAFNPDDDTAVAAGDTLITLGSREQGGPANGVALER